MLKMHEDLVWVKSYKNIELKKLDRKKIFSII